MKKHKKPLVKTKKASLKKSAAKVQALRNKAGVMPLGDRVLVKPVVQETVTSFGIILPGPDKENPEQGIVIKIGPKSSLQIGQHVFFSRKDREEYLFQEIKVGGTEYYIMSENNILGILN